MIGKSALKRGVQIRRLATKQAVLDVVRPRHHRDGFTRRFLVSAIQLKAIDQPNEHAGKRAIVPPNVLDPPHVGKAKHACVAFIEKVVEGWSARGKSQNQGREIPTTAGLFIGEHRKEDFETQRRQAHVVQKPAIPHITKRRTVMKSDAVLEPTGFFARHHAPRLNAVCKVFKRHGRTGERNDGVHGFVQTRPLDEILDDWRGEQTVPTLASWKARPSELSDGLLVFVRRQEHLPTLLGLKVGNGFAPLTYGGGFFRSGIVDAAEVANGDRHTKVIR